MRKARDTREEIRDYFRDCIGHTFHTPKQSYPFDIVEVTDYIIKCKPHRSEGEKPQNVYILDMERLYHWLVTRREQGPKNSVQVSKRLVKNKRSASYIMPLMEEYYKYIQLHEGKIFYNPTRMDLMF